MNYLGWQLNINCFILRNQDNSVSDWLIFWNLPKCLQDIDNRFKYRFVVPFTFRNAIMTGWTRSVYFSTDPKTSVDFEALAWWINVASKFFRIELVTLLCNRFTRGFLMITRGNACICASCVIHKPHCTSFQKQTLYLTNFLTMIENLLIEQLEQTLRIKLPFLYIWSWRSLRFRLRCSTTAHCITRKLINQLI